MPDKEFENNWAKLGDPYEYDMPPYKICFLDGEEIKHLVLPYNDVNEALITAKSLMRSNQIPVFIEGVAAAHFENDWLVRHPHSDPFKKLEKYKKYRKDRPFRSKK